MDMSKTIADLFIYNETVSFAMDIAPIIMREYSYQFLEDRVYDDIEKTIQHAIDMASGSRVYVTAVPKFTGDMHSGSLVINDIEYRRLRV